MEAGALRAPAALNRISVTAPLLRLRSDDQLVALFRAGNDAAFTVIHDRYRQRLFAYSRQMLGGSRQDAEDALQDVFLRAYSSLRTNERPVSLRAWLYRVAHNRCIDHLRKPVPPAIDLFETSRKPLHDPIAEAERRDDLRQLILDVRRLPEQQRSALLMREMDGLSYAELADVLGVSLPAVKSLLVRARIGLVEAIEARDTACSEIRTDLADAFDRGVRASGRARRHLRDCAGCTDYRTQLRTVHEGFGALSPAAGPWTAVLKLIGLGGAGSAGAASAGGGAAAGGGALVTAGGGTAAKVAAVVCCAALTAGGAVEVTERIVKPSRAGEAVTAAAASAKRSAAAAAATTAASTSAIPAQRNVARESQPVTRIGATGSETPDPAVALRYRERATTLDRGAASLTGSSMTSAHDTDAITGGSSAPDEDGGFGHGIHGLTPTTAAGPDPASSIVVAPEPMSGSTTAGGYSAPPDGPAVASTGTEPAIAGSAASATAP